MAIKPADREIGELYREAGAAGPTTELDRNILIAARAAIENQTTPSSWWTRWRLPFQVVTTICLVVIVGIMVAREPLLPAIAPLAMNSNAPTAETRQAPPQTPSPASIVAESSIRGMADQAPTRARSEAIMAPSLPPSAPSAPPLGETSKETVPSSATARTVVTAESPAVAPGAKPETGATASAKAVARATADQAMPPKEWLISIEMLINQNRLDEARKRLEAFVQAYPAETVPEGIKAKLKAAPDGDHLR